jgi:hypothetical protein
MDDLMKLPEDTRTALEKLEDRAKTIVVRTHDERTALYIEIKGAKSNRSKIIDFFKDMKKKADEAHSAICAKEKSFTDKIDAFEKIGKAAIKVFDDAEEAKRLAEQSRLQAIENEKARKERERATQEAARQRQIQEESQRKADEARRLAEAADAAEKAKLLKEAEASERAAAAANAKADAKTELANSVTAPVIEVAKTIEKEKGESTKKVWKGRVKDINLVSVENFRIIWAYFTDAQKESAINSLARATKGNLPMPGIEFFCENNLAMRS